MTKIAAKETAATPAIAAQKVARKPRWTAGAQAIAAEPAAPQGPKGKLGVVVGMLLRSEGATIEDLIQATGWQAHSVRGAIAGAVKKKLGFTVASEKVEGGRIYRITRGAGA